jgi:hypothetical protein
MENAEKKSSSRETQRETVETYRAQSILNRQIPLGKYATGAATPENGLTVRDYFRAKHERGEAGKYDPLYRLALPRLH